MKSVALAAIVFLGTLPSAGLPVVSSISPNSAVAGSPGFQIQVVGSGFSHKSVVQWNGSSRTTLFADAQHLSATIKSIDLLTAGTARVTVANQGAVSNALSFSIAPAVTTLQIVTPSLPSGQLGTAYSVPLAASGGLAPYVWSITSGALPAGLTLSPAGVVSGNPAVFGTFTIAVSVHDSSSPLNTAASSYNLTILQAPLLQLTTASLPAGQVQQPYSATLSATGGYGAYGWLVTGGALPQGLNLNATSGVLSGTPSQSGSFSATIRVNDASLPYAQVAYTTFAISIAGATQQPPQPPSGSEIYGGSTQLPCPAGPSTFFTTQKIGNRWWLCTPAGNVFWMRSVYVVDADDTTDFNGVNYKSLAIAKYGDGDLTWGPQQNRRLQGWGFNSLAEYASLYTQATTTNSSWPGGKQPVPMPFSVLAWPGYYSLINSGGFANAPVKELVRSVNTTYYRGYQGMSPDVWDPNFKSWLDGFLQHEVAATQWINGPNNSFVIGFNVDDADDLFGFGAGPDFTTIANGQPGGGREQVHLGWIALVTPPTQTANQGLSQSYSDTTVYTKKQFAAFLQQRYTSVAALNAAWGAEYTSLGTSGGWGTGTGLLDEDGRNSWVPRDSTRLNDATAAMRKDLDDFLFLHAQQYFSVIKASLSTYAPGRLYLGPTTLGTWGTPARKQVLQAAAPYIDVYMAPSIPAGVADDQQRIDFVFQNVGDKPWLQWEGFAGQPDSYMDAFPASDTVQPQSSSQAQRGQTFVSMINLLTGAHTTSGVYPVVGYKWWQLIDNRGERMNWGLVTRRDNEYDGVASAVNISLDLFGFKIGGEVRNYGDFISSVRSANQGVMPFLLSKSW